jgi:hypothetical protein
MQNGKWMGNGWEMDGKWMEKSMDIIIYYTPIG